MGILPHSTNRDGKSIAYSPSFLDCSLHPHSVTVPHNFGRVFSLPAPGLIVGVGSVGGRLPYEECDMFLSTDAGVSSPMARPGARKYEFGDSGSVLSVVDDEDVVNTVQYSTNHSKD